MLDIYSISLIFAPPICAGIGYLVKYYIDRSAKNQQFIIEKKLEEVEHKLDHFYFPIYINLIREELIWKKIITAECNTAEDSFRIELDKEILQAHLANQTIIRENIIRVNPSLDLYNLFMAYEEHITIFSILRNIYKNITNFDDYKFPYEYGSPYPNQLLYYITLELEKLKTEQSKLYESMV